MGFQLTRRALRTLADIHAVSTEKFGGKVADQYLTDLYATFGLLARKPGLGASRRKRAAPFHMYPAREHFVLFEPEEEDIIIVAILAQVQDIEAIVATVAKEIKAEIEMLRRRADLERGS